MMWFGIIGMVVHAFICAIKDVLPPWYFMEFGVWAVIAVCGAIKEGKNER